MAAEDWLPFDSYDEDEGTIICKSCGADGLHWEEARGERNEKRWVLMEETGQVHACPNAPSAADADEFPMIEPNQHEDNAPRSGAGVGPTTRQPVRKNSPIRKRTPTDGHKESGSARPVCAKRSRAVDTVPRKHDVSRKPKNGRRK